ncbi:glycerol-3-phosphate acyltransferase [Mangrovicoccus ximenensis]|uniref:glycerol-3-phosphate acyltransferase n=1 Tax=Mangrovicoccus ximenensis TaxID=1911570 RepID=UPI0022AAB462|nr:glycerol-3-phosphate acyltransferase [Mangrovicoccus ximenensis]
MGHGHGVAVRSRAAAASVVDLGPDADIEAVAGVVLFIRFVAIAVAAVVMVGAVRRGGLADRAAEPAAAADRPALRISSLSALVAAALSPVWAWALGRGDMALLCVVLAVLVFLRHRPNIARILAGTEPKIGRK